MLMHGRGVVSRMSRVLTGSFKSPRVALRASGIRFVHISPPSDEGCASCSTLNIPDASDVVASSDFLSFLPVNYLTDSLHFLDTNLGLPLWAGIAGSCIVLRASVVPLLYLHQCNLARLSHASASLGFLRYLFFKDKEQSLMEKIPLYRKASWAIRSRAGHSRLLSWPYPLVQLPSFLIFVFTLRQVLAKDPAMATGGMLWFENLMMKDSSFVLPACAVGLTYLTLEGLLPSGKNERQNVISRFISAYQTILILSFPFVCQIPAGVFMYWIPSSLWTMAQGSVLRNEKVRRWFGFSMKKTDMKVSSKPGGAKQQVPPVNSPKSK